VIVDTSVWINHLRIGDARLAAQLEEGTVLVHPFIVGELACGNLRNRQEILSLLEGLPTPKLAEHDEAIQLVEREQLHGRGIGWVDVHLLASARLSGVSLWTLDRRLSNVATSLGVGI
jgi:hypothetical protein